MKLFLFFPNVHKMLANEWVNPFRIIRFHSIEILFFPLSLIFAAIFQVYIQS